MHVPGGGTGTGSGAGGIENSRHGYVQNVREATKVTLTPGYYFGNQVALIAGEQSSTGGKTSLTSGKNTQVHNHIFSLPYGVFGVMKAKSYTPEGSIFNAPSSPHMALSQDSMPIITVGAYRCRP